jgi:hypothetical protein
MSVGVMYASMKSFWYPLGSSGGVAPGHADGLTTRETPPRLEVAVILVGCAGTTTGSDTWYWYSPASSKRCSA